MTEAVTTTTSHVATRLDIATSVPFETFCDALESAAPRFQRGPIDDIAARGGSWDEVLAAVARNAPHGLMIFSSLEAAPLMATAGIATRATGYLIGNHTIAERMFRHDPLALLYAPLRMLVHADDDGNAVLSLDQPSTLFGSLEDPRITAVGRELDGKVRGLLHAMGIEAHFPTDGD
ncbi:hypothetical protein MMAD_44400 [Mycolicibacterium madagascariense]|uniref:DUF302 domain-containing protein n=1 Tax=Mycolicibacterium madagascariense TaxID=212765 RepID=A0A7I7XLU0_9MYCO|nr:DUF302 domain-containing protein [Mycolicibacterium madagascariense]MCV7012468.1 DUF302 domain-containing protein [Mycolicibacterium madagascariense]BBZ30145.1 hypothetical protein MMAD_44400 [Mycolicibacterium madagascariense]